MILNKPSYQLPFEYLLDNQNYYYIDCSNYHILPGLHEYKELCDNNNYILLIDNSVEGWKSLVDDIYEYLVIPYDWEENNIMLISGDADIVSYVDYVAKKLNKKPIRSLWSNRFEVMIANQIDANLRYDRREFKTWEKRSEANFIKTYLCLNRRWRLHRPALVALLGVKGILEKGHVSLSTADQTLNWEDVIPGLSRIHRSNSEICNIFTNQTDIIYKIPKLSLDRPTLEETTLFNLEQLLCPFYEQSLISVVTETNFYTNFYNKIVHEGTRFFSEKTFKPIAHKHPFILVSVPNCLNILKQIGYQTFHPFIDESYDNEHDDSIRLLKIVNEIERISKFTKEEVKEFVKQTMPICEYNYKLLLTKSQIK